MEITVTKENSFIELIIRGDVDASSAIKVDEALETFLHEKKDILVDCGELEYISSAGLGVFMSYFSDFEENGNHLVLFGMSESVYKVFELIGLTALLSIVNNKKEALALVV